MRGPFKCSAKREASLARITIYHAYIRITTCVGTSFSKVRDPDGGGRKDDIFEEEEKEGSTRGFVPRIILRYRNILEACLNDVYVPTTIFALSLIAPKPGRGATYRYDNSVASGKGGCRRSRNFAIRIFRRNPSSLRLTRFVPFECKSGIRLYSFPGWKRTYRRTVVKFNFFRWTSGIFPARE